LAVIKGVFREEVVKMKFYEFTTDKFEYYALIGADSMGEAIKEYVDEICDIEDEERENEPKELSIGEAINHYRISDLNNKHYLRDFDRYTNEYNPCLLLIDGCLL